MLIAVNDIAIFVTNYGNFVDVFINLIVTVIFLFSQLQIVHVIIICC